MQPGDVFIKGGSPGHAVIVVDMAVNSSGKKIFLLAQSYMPAQDIHILNNPMSPEFSPWYELNDNSLIYTPEWVFKTGAFKKMVGKSVNFRRFGGRHACIKTFFFLL